MRLLTGGYSADMDGDATGIGMLHAGEPDEGSASGPLAFTGDAVAVGGSPSWVAAHPRGDVVYAALEGAGAVRAFRRTGEASFAPLGAAVPVGELPCHVAVAPDGGSLVVACWGDGRVVRLGLDAAGVPSTPVAAEPAVDPHPAPVVASGTAPVAAREHLTDEGSGESRSLGAQMFSRGQEPAGIDLAAAARALREAAGEEYAHLVPAYDAGADAGPAAGEGTDAVGRASRAHQTVFLPGGALATTDMGLDLVRFWRPRGDGLRAAGRVVLPRGSGPRHGMLHPSGHLYVVTELSHEVYVLAREEGADWRVVGGTGLGAGLLPDDAAAELCASRDGEFLYAGVRGSDTIAVLRVRGDGSRVEPAALVESGVAWPRHHVVVRDTLLVAGQRSGEVASLSLDPRTGVPGRVRHRTPVPSPTCLLPVR